MNWETALKDGWYVTESLEKEGFIHTSFHNQVPGVLQRYYKDLANLVLLHIDEYKVIPRINYEIAPSVNETFPHIYGRLNIDAVVKVTDI